MNQIKDPKIFETQNVDLASYLMMEGIKLIECRKVDDRKIVVMRFLDDKQNCLDLERVFINSPFKRYRDINKYLLTKIFEALR